MCVPSTRITKTSMFPPSGPLLIAIHLPSGEKLDDATWVPVLKCVSCLRPVPSGRMRKICDWWSGSSA